MSAHTGFNTILAFKHNMPQIIEKVICGFELALLFTHLVILKLD
jgi:hypothetical protein